MTTDAELITCQRYGCRMLPTRCIEMSAEPKCRGCGQVRWIRACREAAAMMRVAAREEAHGRD